MKHLLMAGLLFSFGAGGQSFPETPNWFPVTKDGANTSYTDKSSCERIEGFACYDVSKCPVDECSLGTVSGKKQLVRSSEKIEKKKLHLEEQNKARIDREERVNRIKVGCEKSEGLLKDLCDEFINNPRLRGVGH